MRIKEIQNFDPYDLIKFLNQEATKDYQHNEQDFNAGMAFMLACVRKYFNDSFDIPIRDNNDWISIKKHGLPKESGKYLVYSYADDDVWTSDFCVDLDKFNFHHENITHYQKIQLPNME